MASVEELEGTVWDPPSNDATPLVRRCHELRRRDVGALAVEELRTLIGQEIGLPWLVPIAVDRLDDDPFASGDLYPGDLFVSLVGVPESYWAQDSPSWLRLHALAEQLASLGDQAATWLATTTGGA